ncbi:MAG: hypothetical protein OXE85_03220 [Roseovarius sp.]|nr:hypothetical protein [Roseovarius sp.]
MLDKPVAARYDMNHVQPLPDYLVQRLSWMESDVLWHRRFMVQLSCPRMAAYSRHCDFPL